MIQSEILIQLTRYYLYTDFSLRIKTMKFDMKNLHGTGKWTHIFFIFKYLMLLWVEQIIFEGQVVALYTSYNIIRDTI